MNAPKLSSFHRALQRIIRGMGWKIQGQLGAHYRPLLLVTCRPASPFARSVRWMFLRALPDRDRIQVVEVDPSCPIDGTVWNRLREEASWISCLALDVRRRQVVIHRPFPKGKHVQRESAYVCRYLGYFASTPHTPAPNESAREADGAGY